MDKHYTDGCFVRILDVLTRFSAMPPNVRESSIEFECDGRLYESDYREFRTRCENASVIAIPTENEQQYHVTIRYHPAHPAPANRALERAYAHIGRK
jgi:hypothetical protein